MGQFLADIIGLINSYIKLGGAAGPRIKANSGRVEFRDTGDTAYATGRAANIAASGNINDIVTLLDLQGRIPEITFDFDGASAPSPGANTGEFGICHTTGGGYTQRRVYYDTGAALTLMPTEVVRTITTSTAITGAVSFIAGGLYAAPDGVTWALRGDGSGTASGASRTVRVNFVYSDTDVDSTTDVPDGSVVTAACIVITTPLGGTPTVALTINGSSPETLIGTGSNDATVAGETETRLKHEITSSNEGKVRVTVAGGATAGAGYALVKFCTPLA